MASAHVSLRHKTVYTFVYPHTRPHSHDKQTNEASHTAAVHSHVLTCHRQEVTSWGSRAIMVNIRMSSSCPCNLPSSLMTAASAALGQVLFQLQRCTRASAASCCCTMTSP